MSICMDNVSAAVVTHPSRFEAAVDLARKLPASVILDEGYGLTRNHLRAWRCVSVGKFGLVVQDDIAVDYDLLRKQIATYMQDPDESIATFYSVYAADLVALNSGASQRRFRGAQFRGELAVMMPQHMISEYFVWAKDNWKELDPKLKWHDFLVAKFLQATNRDVVTMLPNSVQHRNREFKSTVGHPAAPFGKERVSATYHLR